MRIFYSDIGCQRPDLLRGYSFTNQTPPNNLPRLMTVLHENGPFLGWGQQPSALEQLGKATRLLRLPAPLAPHPEEVKS